MSQSILLYVFSFFNILEYVFYTCGIVPLVSRVCAALSFVWSLSLACVWCCWVHFLLLESNTFMFWASVGFRSTSGAQQSQVNPQLVVWGIQFFHVLSTFTTFILCRLSRDIDFCRTPGDWIYFHTIPNHPQTKFWSCCSQCSLSLSPWSTSGWASAIGLSFVMSASVLGLRPFGCTASNSMSRISWVPRIVSQQPPLVLSCLVYRGVEQRTSCSEGRGGQMFAPQVMEYTDTRKWVERWFWSEAETLDFVWKATLVSG